MKITGIEKLSTKILVGEVPTGFFTGRIGVHAGLFFRSRYDVTFLSPAKSGDGGDFSAYWGYAFGSDTVCEVLNYRPVDVNIEVQS